MIKPSRQRSERSPASTLLRLHERIARRRHVSRRLWLASVAACTVSLPLWLAAVPIAWHVSLIVLAFGIGLSLPSRSATPWALAWIGRHSGLSYQTALELSEHGDEEKYGFSEAVRERAVAQAKRMELPEQQPWWLPFLFIAVLLAFLPVVPFRTTTRAPLLSTPSSAVTTQTDTEETVEAAQSQDAPTTAEEPPAPPNDPSQSPEGAAESAPTLDDFGSAGGGSAEAGGSGAADEEALERFLETLRERPQQEQQESNPFSGVSPNEPQGTPEGSSGSQQGEPTEAEGEQPQEGQGESQSGEGGEPQAGETPQEGEQGQGEEGQSGEQEGEEMGGSNEGGEQGETQGQGEGMSPDPQGEPSQEGAQPREGDSGDGAGDGGALPLQVEGQDLGEPGEDPEQLRGRLNNGPSNLAGTVRLPSGEEIAPTTNAQSSSSFSRSEEQAITEGRIPVEYQDIIRNYFR